MDRRHWILQTRYALLLDCSENTRFSILQGTNIKAVIIYQLYCWLHHNQVSIRQLESEFFAKVRYLDNSKEKKVLSYVERAQQVVKYEQKHDRE